MLLEVLLIGSCVGWRAAALSNYSEFPSRNEWECDQKEWCEGRPELQPTDSIWAEYNCQCDKECSNYGDCCRDSPYFKLSEQRRAESRFTCVKVNQYDGIYMLTSCPSDWDEPSTRAACETASENIRDPLPGFPLTDISTGVTYRNYFCAVCHRAEEKSYIWQPRVECHSLPSNHSLNSQNVSQQLKFNEKKRSWGLNLENKFYPCDIVPEIPPQNNLTRECVPNVIKKCDDNWDNVDISNLCEAYTALIYVDDNNYSVYRNGHCADCNNVNSSLLVCASSTARGSVDALHKIDLKNILTLPVNGLRESIIECLLKNNKIFDIYNHPTTNSKCKNVLQKKVGLVSLNDTLHVQKYGNQTEICTNEEEFNPYTGYITFVGLGISIVLLVLHLTNFCLVPELRNLFGKNLASLCVSLLMGYISIMIGAFLQGTSCFIVAIIRCYAFLAAFTWMLTMAFDIWRTLRLATDKLRVSTGKKWRKFIVYSLWSWLFPAGVVLMALWAEQTPGVDTDLRPGFNSNSCWFSHRRSMITFFVWALAVVMLLNVTFFAFSAHMIYSTTRDLNTTRFTSRAGTQRDFRLYLRLAVLMGLTWTTGLVAGFFNIEFLWYLFVLLNSFQGLFIFLAFTYHYKIIQLTKTLVWGSIVSGYKRQFIPLSSIYNSSMNS